MKTASEKLEELRKRDPMLAEIFQAIPINRRALASEERAAEDAGRKRIERAEQQELEALDELAPKTAHLRRLKNDGDHTLACIFEQANAHTLRREERLINGIVESDDDEQDEDGPEAA